MKHKISLKIVSAAMAVLLLAVGTVPALAEEAETTAAKPAFSDVASDAWYHDAVSHVSEAGLMNGTSTTAFSPNQTLTRAMFVTILSRIAGVGADSYYSSDFADVKDGSWCVSGVEWAYQTGVVSGYSNGKFGTKDPVTREQMAAMIGRAIANSDVKLANAADAPASFQDAASVASYAQSGLELMRKTGIIQGDAQGSFNPKRKTSRAQAAVVFTRLDSAITAYSDTCAKDVTTLASAKNYAITEHTLLHNLRNDIRYPQLTGTVGTAEATKAWNDSFYKAAQNVSAQTTGSITKNSFKARQADETMLSFTEDVFFYGDGAAHGSSSRSSLNINPSTGKQVRLPEVCDTAAIAKALLSKKGYVILTSEDKVAGADEVSLQDILSMGMLSSGKEEDVKKMLDSFDSANASELAGYSYWENGKLCLICDVSHAAGDFCIVRFDSSFLKTK